MGRIIYHKEVSKCWIVIASKLSAPKSKTSSTNDRLIEIRSTDADAAEFGTANGRRSVEQMNGVNERLIAALQKEDTEAQAAVATNADTSGWTHELREFRKLGQRVTIRDYVAAATEERHVDGAAKEYNEHVFGTYAQGDYPLEMLLDRDEYFDMDSRTWGTLVTDEKRAEITGTSATGGNLSFADRLLANSEAAYIGASFPTVGPGRHSYPIVSGTTVAGVIARGTAETPAGGLSIQSADPERIQHSYEYAAADELQMPGIANALASDLRASLMSGLDNKVVDDAYTATAAAVSATAITRQTMAKIFGAFGHAVNGIGARDVREVRLMVAQNVYADAAALSIANVGHFFTLMPHDRYRASAHLENLYGLAYRTGSNIRRLLVPVWRRGTLLRDTGRLQLAGTVTLTGVMYADVILVNVDQHVAYTFAIT